VWWVTDYLLIFTAYNEKQQERLVQFALEKLEPVTAELVRMTTLEEVSLQNKSLLKAEVDRFHELGSLLQQSFDLIHESLCLNPGRKTGTKEIVTAIHEMVIAVGEKVRAVREYSSFRQDGAPISDAFRIVSTAAMEQLNEWHLPLRLEIALSTMLEALPKLEDSVFSKMDIHAWGPILVRHGMQKSVTNLAAAVNERRAASKTSTSRPTKRSLHPLQASDHTPRYRISKKGLLRSAKKTVNPAQASDPVPNPQLQIHPKNDGGRNRHPRI
jgi:hypothetical protein